MIHNTYWREATARFYTDYLASGHTEEAIMIKFDELEIQHKTMGSPCSYSL